MQMFWFLFDRHALVWYCVKVDDKYQYSCDNKDSSVHGWISTDPPVGFWLITPSNEFRSGGPVKQNLTSHVGPTTLAVSDSSFILPSFMGLFNVWGHQKPESWLKTTYRMIRFLLAPITRERIWSLKSERARRGRKFLVLCSSISTQLTIPATQFSSGKMPKHRFLPFSSLFIFIGR